MASSINENLLREILDLIESKELELLEIGIVDSALTRIDVDQIAISVVDSEANEYVEELFSRGAIFEFAQGIRSRMAETVRLLSHMRQVFPNGKATEGKPLVWDYRILRQPRRRPEADVDPSHLIAAVPGITDFQRKIVLEISPKNLRSFQVLGTQEVLARLKERTESGVMISAGTGSGKTLAFYMPTILAIAEMLRADQSNWVKTLAVYPRNELLKDQFSSILEYVYRVSNLPGSPRPIRIGAWFGETPFNNEYAKEDWRVHTDGTSLIFPLAKCPKCTSGTLIWREDDRKNKIERLICAVDSCGTKLPAGMIGLTRIGMNDSPVDVLFSSTESINRQLADTSTHKAFGFSGVERLRMVLLDEIHTYEGLTGAQNAYLMRRIKHVVQSPIVWVGLSATLSNAEDFMGQMVNLPPALIQVVKPADSDLKPFGAEYSIALRHDPTQRHGVLSLTLQTAMLMGRVLDATPKGLQKVKSSQGMFGKRTFIFTDKLDVTNRMYWQLMDIEGWDAVDRPKTGSGPKTLAHLRSASQSRMTPANQEQKSTRDADGQWWQISEELGFKLDVDNGLKVTRVSSQEPGVDDKSELVVATATLEVGYSDNNVGVVIQHKAPSDPARFIQRKGRAGRSIEMRPWTVVTLSEWGRDKLAWQLYDQFLFPQIANKHLPVNNRYVQRIQAVFATMDWLALRLANIGQFSLSTRTDLVGPANVVEKKASSQAVRLERQRRAQQILENILQRGEEFDGWRSHLKASLDLSDSDIDFLLVSPPRPLLLALIPTMHRRLATQWAEEPVNAEDPDVKRRNPLLDFAPSSLFADLLSREVSVILPANQNGTNQNPDSDDKSLPVLRVLREFMPGNVSRHFGSKKTDIHWIDPSNGAIDVLLAYKATKVCVVDLPDGSQIDMYQPTQLALQSVPRNVHSTSSSAANWLTNYEPVGTGSTVDLPPQLNGSAMVQVQGFVHSNGAALRVRRFAVKSLGSTVTAGGGRVGISNTFSFNGEPVAIGFEYEADAIQITIQEVSDSKPTTWELRDRAIEYLNLTTDMPESVNSFDREKLGLVLQAVACYVNLSQGVSPSALAGFTDHRLLAEMEKVLAVVVGDDGSDDGTPINTDAATDMRNLLNDSVVLGAIRTALRYLSGLGTGWTEWRQRRLAVTTGACFLGGCQIVVPDVDMDDLQLDVSKDGLSILISEMSPGGNGQVERIIEAISDSGIAFTHAFRRQADPGETEILGTDLSRAIEALVNDVHVRNQGHNLLKSWAGGQPAVYSAFSELENELERAEVRTSPALVTSLTSRFLGPSGMLESVDLAEDIRKEVEKVSLSVGFDVDFRISLWIIEQLFAGRLVNSHPKATVGRDFRRTIEMISWPTGRSAASYDMSPRSGFEPLPMADRRLMAGYLGRSTAELTFKIDNESSIARALIDDGEALISMDATELSELRESILKGLANPMESGPMLVYPKITGLELVKGRYRIRLALEEGASWLA